MRTNNPSGYPSADTSYGTASTLWTQRREATLNWLALGLLLAAWNAVDDSDAPRRPDSLRAYSHVTVRSLVRSMDFSRSS